MLYGALHLYAGLLILEMNMEYRLTEDWKDIKEIIIFGFGKVAHDNIDF